MAQRASWAWNVGYTFDINCPQRPKFKDVVSSLVQMINGRILKIKLNGRNSGHWSHSILHFLFLLHSVCVCVCSISEWHIGNGGLLVYCPRKNIQILSPLPSHSTEPQSHSLENGFSLPSQGDSVNKGATLRGCQMLTHLGSNFVSQCTCFLDDMQTMNLHIPL